ncbi:MAG: bifunctional YncE family protein/alkaline phosphatase family protein [Bacteroidota bacterium]
MKFKNLQFLLMALLFWSCQQDPTTTEEAYDREVYQSMSAQRYTLPNGWSLTPAGQHLPLGDLPLNLLISKDEKRAAVVNCGQSTHSVMWFDIENDSLLDEYELPKAWYGLAMNEVADQLYVSGAFDNMVRTFSMENDKLVQGDSIVLGEKWREDTIMVAGLELDEKRNQLYIVTKEDNSFYTANLETKEIINKIELGEEAYHCMLSADGNSLYISIWGGKEVAVVDLDNQSITQRIKTGSHPNDMVLSKDGNYLFVACSDENAVDVIDLAEGKVIETMVASLYADAPTGSTTNSVALSDDGAMLAVANADNNCVVLFNVEEPGESRSMGFIPTGWYPTAVSLVGEKIYVANGKGLSSAPNSDNGPNPYERRNDSTQYIGGLFKGTLSIIDAPNAEELAAYNKMVYENTPYEKDKEMNPEGEAGNPIPQTVGGESPIKYVFYVIKENRTYDQVFGDMPEGNGDASICLFPDSVSPNHHKLAREFVLFDNFYVDAEVSADGHNWSTAAYANDYVEKSWPTSYGGRGGTYDYEGRKDIAYPRDGFIWDFCERAGVSFRTYGEFANLNEAYHETLEGHTAPRFPGYNTGIRDMYRYEQWQIDFDSLLALGQVPQFNIVRFGNDHTAGTRIGYPTPRAMMADNDLATGKLVEYLSKSPIWKETAIFITEDDAQNGPDHVDAHRSILLVASPYTRRKHVDHTMYSTSSILRTMELILGLPPMSQYDAAAMPMYRTFTADADFSPYVAAANQIDLDEMNKEQNRLSMLSEMMNLDQEDQAPDILLNQVIWKAIKGMDAEMPAPRKAAFVMRAMDEDE